MGKTSHRFSVGGLECILVLDGYHDYPDPAKGFFANAEGDEAVRWLKSRGDDPDNWTVYKSPYPALIVFNNEQTILVDTGAGSFDPSTGNLLRNLEREGVSADQIDTVVVTHAHPDHVGGVTDDEGNLVFPGARHVIHRAEWEFWNSSACEDGPSGRMAPMVRKCLIPLKDRIELIDGDGDLAPGVRAVLAPGHTPGHMCVEIGSDKERLVYISDLVLLPHHLERPEWFYRAEVDMAASLATRKRVCAALARDQVLVQAFHFEWPGLGYIVPKGEAWAWQPQG